MLSSSSHPVVCPEFLQDPTNPTMIMGACVASPAPGTGQPAVTALVGSVDSVASKYVTTHRLQHSRLEGIEGIVDFEEMAKNLIKMFQRHQELVEKKTTIGPKRIVYYRHGVSEDQSRIVLENELPALKRACEASGLKPLPKITIVTLGQRHHTRMMPLAGLRPMTSGTGNRRMAGAAPGGSHNRRARPTLWQNISDMAGWNPNPPAMADATTAASIDPIFGHAYPHEVRFPFPMGRGEFTTGNPRATYHRHSTLANDIRSIFDEVIERPPMFDFFLLGHDGLTTNYSRPTHYSVVHDDNEFTPESLQELTFDLSLNTGEESSMSVPAPIYHARLVCIQAKEYHLPSARGYSPPNQGHNSLNQGQNSLMDELAERQVEQRALRASMIERLQAASALNPARSAARYPNNMYLQ